MSQEQFKTPRNFWRRHKQIDPITPLPDTGAQRYNLLQMTVMAQQDTGKTPVTKVTGPVKTYTRIPYVGSPDLKACDVVICAINKNKRETQLYPKEILACQSFYDELATDFFELFSEPFEGYFPVYGIAESILVSIDQSMSRTLPFGTVLCIN